jgi:hypothetical protein
MIYNRENSESWEKAAIAANLNELGDHAEAFKRNENIDEVCRLECNIDDMSAEELSFAKSLLMNEGALDVYTTAVHMKKNRDGLILTCLCHIQDEERFIKLIFRHTATIGIRTERITRYCMTRSIANVDTEYGSIKVKISEGFGIRKIKPEYDDVARLAEKCGKTFDDINLSAMHAANEKYGGNDI